MADDPKPGQAYLAGFALRLATVRVAYGAMTGRPRLTRAAFAAEIGLNPDALQTLRARRDRAWTSRFWLPSGA